MSFELESVVRSCGIETGARRAVLAMLAHYADLETGLCRISRVTLAYEAGLHEKTVQKALSELCADPDLDGLVRCLKAGNGRGHASVYKVDYARLEPLAFAVRTAGRRVFAGVKAALIDAGLAGMKASADNIRAAFRVIDRVLAEEEEHAARRSVQGYLETFEGVMLERRNICVIGRPIEPAKPSPTPVDKPPKGESLAPLSGPLKGSLSLRKGSLSLQAHSIDTSPSGNIPLARETRPDPACGKILVGAAVTAGAFVFETEGLLAHATVSRRERLDLIADLQGRLARITPDGLLAIRARSGLDAEALARRWLEPLLGWAGDVGLAGVVFDAAFPAPPESADAAGSHGPGSWRGGAVPEPAENLEV